MTTTPTIAVTGAAGYIGSRVVVDLQRTHPNWTIQAFDNFYAGDVRQIGDIAVEHLDIRDRARLERAIADADIVMHLAAISGVDDCENNPDLAYEVNVQGTENVAWACQKQGTGLVFPFSMGVLGDPETFPITTGHPRDPLNWYGRTKLLNERAIETLAEGTFPAHLFMKSNLYGEHEIGGKRVSKGTVTNFFVDRALEGETLTVYEPGTQSRNYVHVKDVARAYVQSAEHLLDQLTNDATGTWKYTVASQEDPSVMEVAETVQALTNEEHGIEVDIELQENPRDETLVSHFAVDIDATTDDLGWEPQHTLTESVRELLRRESA